MSIITIFDHANLFVFFTKEYFNGAVIEEKKDTSKKDRTTNAGRKYSACDGLFWTYLFSIKNSPLAETCKRCGSRSMRAIDVFVTNSYLKTALYVFAICMFRYTSPSKNRCFSPDARFFWIFFKINFPEFYFKKNLLV